MRLQVCFKLAVLLLVAQFCLAGQALAFTKEVVKQANLGFKAGYRVDSLDWSIGSPGGFLATGTPNILSELKYDNLKSAQMQVDGSVDVGNANYPNITVHVRGMAGWGKILAGDNQDSDYAGDNRTLEFSRSNNDVSDDYTLDFDFALGPKFSMANDSFYILPLIGYSYHELNLTTTEGNQTVSNQANADVLFGPGVFTVQPLGPFVGLNSSYDATMDGLYGGLEIGIIPSDNFSILLGGKFHSFDYDADADWNLRSDFAHPVSFHHIAEGSGVSAHADIIIGISDGWTLNFSGLYRDWSTDPGTDITFFADATTSSITLIEADWKSYSGMVGVTYHFK